MTLEDGLMDLYRRKTTKSLLRGVAQTYSNAVGSALLEWDRPSEAWWVYAYTSRMAEKGYGEVLWSERYVSIKQARVDFDMAILVLMDLSEAKELSDGRQ